MHHVKLLLETRPSCHLSRRAPCAAQPKVDLSSDCELALLRCVAWHLRMNLEGSVQRSAASSALNKFTPKAFFATDIPLLKGAAE